MEKTDATSPHKYPKRVAKQGASKHTLKSSPVRKSQRKFKPVKRYEQSTSYFFNTGRVKKWTLKDREKLLDILTRNDVNSLDDNQIFYRMKTKTKLEIKAYMANLRKKAARHSRFVRERQPPILSWFQMADELSWLKGDEDNLQILGKMMSAAIVEANAIQQKVELLNFSKLYQYLVALLHGKALPDITPVESIVLLDCFHYLANLLRSCDTTQQERFMREQYHKYFSVLNYGKETEPSVWIASEPGDEDEPRIGKRGRKPKSYHSALKVKLPSKKGPHSKAVLTKRERKSRTPKKIVKGDGEQIVEKIVKGDGEQIVTENASQLQSGSKKDSSRNEVSANGEEEGMRDGQGVNIHEEAHDTRSTQGYILHSGQDDVVDQLRKELGPDSDEFLAKCAESLSLGSLNCFEIPLELLQLKKKTTGVNSERRVPRKNVQTSNSNQVSQPEDEGQRSQKNGDHQEIVITCERINEEAGEASDEEEDFVERMDIEVMPNSSNVKTGKKGPLHKVKHSRDLKM